MSEHTLVPVSKALDDPNDVTWWRCLDCLKRGSWERMHTTACKEAA